MRVWGVKCCVRVVYALHAHVGVGLYVRLGVCGMRVICARVGMLYVRYMRSCERCVCVLGGGLCARCMYVVIVLVYARCTCGVCGCCMCVVCRYIRVVCTYARVLWCYMCNVALMWWRCMCVCHG